MAPDRDRLLQRISKLFTLGASNRNNSEAEAMAAITKARQLMVEHNLSMAEVQAASATPDQSLKIDVRMATAYTVKGTFATYDDALAAAVNYICGVRDLTTRYASGHISRQFIGDVTDVAVAAELFMLLLVGMRKSARRIFGSGWSRRHTAYCNGYSIRCYVRARELAEAAAPPVTSYALVVRSKATAIEEALKNMKPKTAKERKYYMDDPLAVSLGVRDGNRVDLGRESRLRPTGA